MLRHRAITEARWRTAQELEFRGWETEVTPEEEWEEAREKFHTLFPDIARRVELRAADIVLDVGCGPTLVSRLLGTGTLVGIDPLADRFHALRPEAFAGVTVLAAPAEAMPLPDASVDFVLCRNTIDHAQDPLRVMREMQRVLKPGGFLLLICYTYAPFITWMKNTSEQLGVLRNVRHPHTFTPDTLDALAAGLFQIVERFTIHTGQHSTDYGKVGPIVPDRSPLHRALTWVNRHVFRSTWFLKEYGYLARRV